jgi:hypothetical protein
VAFSVTKGVQHDEARVADDDCFTGGTARATWDSGPRVKYDLFWIPLRNRTHDLRFVAASGVE